MDRNGYNPSIMQDEEKCFVCGATNNLVRHEIYGGYANRKLSKEYGLWVWLTPYWHNASNDGVHFNKQLETTLKKAGQMAFERTHTREEFIKIFGRNYL